MLFYLPMHNRPTFGRHRSRGTLRRCRSARFESLEIRQMFNVTSISPEASVGPAEDSHAIVEPLMSSTQGLPAICSAVQGAPSGAVASIAADQDAGNDGDYWYDKQGNRVSPTSAENPARLEVWRGGRMIQKWTWEYHENGEVKTETYGRLSRGIWYETVSERDDRGGLVSETWTLTNDQTSKPIVKFRKYKSGGAWKFEYQEWQSGTTSEGPGWKKPVPIPGESKTWDTIKKELLDKYVPKKTESEQNNEQSFETPPDIAQIALMDWSDDPCMGLVEMATPVQLASGAYVLLIGPRIEMSAPAQETSTAPAGTPQDGQCGGPNVMHGCDLLGIAGGFEPDAPLAAVVSEGDGDPLLDAVDAIAPLISQGCLDGLLDSPLNEASYAKRC